MKNLVLAFALALAGCAGSGMGGWVTVVDDGKGMENFEHFREANWHVTDGALQADRGGKDPKNIGDETCYEANIFDQRPDPTYATGAIVKVAPVPKDFEHAGGKWNTFDITARGNHLVVVMNGKKTVDVMATRNHMSGPFALQWGRGVIKFRKVQIREL